MNNTRLDHYELPPFQRKPPEDSREWAVQVIAGIDTKVARLAARGLRPHPKLIERRAEYVLVLDGCKVTT